MSVVRWLILILYVAIFSCCISPQAENKSGSNPVNKSDNLDNLLQTASEQALGDLEGTVIVIDPQNGRLRAIANQRLALEQAFPPGSTIKPFTTLAALRTGILNNELRTLCKERYIDNSNELICSHPKSHAPFTPTQALAYSCNYYFATLARRLNSNAFYSTLASFGLGSRTGINIGSEATGRLVRDQWTVSDALGDTEHILVTPIQLLSAYTALVNGGHLYKPQRVSTSNLNLEEIRSIEIPDNYRELIIDGMRGAVKYGTASKAKLDTIPLYIFGKTGTSTASNGFRTQGWFVGFASDNKLAGRVSPKSIRLAVLVFLKRAHGSQGAEVARSIFETFANNYDKDEQVSNDVNIEEQTTITNESTSVSTSPTVSIKVHLVSENLTKTLPLEDYMLGVLAAESSVEREVEALKAQAVISRTFAIKNLGRHKNDGYDFCSTTHCQRYSLLRNQINQRAKQAIEETVGKVLRDGQGNILDAYFHAACGGHTANIESLWGVTAPPVYLRGVKDDYCVAMPHRYWQQSVSSRDLTKALNSDSRTLIGSKLENINISKVDSSGRAQELVLEGERRRVVNGWDFKIIVGRSLGWNILKSSKFEVVRNGSNFLFRGNGFGHGLGLCQEGAHVMAERHISFEQILNHYFPNTKLDKLSIKDSRAEASLQPTNSFPNVRDRLLLSALTLHSLPSPNRLLKLLPSWLHTNTTLSLSSEHFQVTYPSSIPRREVEDLLQILEAARGNTLRRIDSLSGYIPGKVKVMLHETTQDFTAATGQPWWTSAATRVDRIHLQPIKLLRRRNILLTTLRHEYTHTVIEALSKGNAPRWITEGLSIHVAGEARFYSSYEPKQRYTIDDLENRLSNPSSAEEMRTLYKAAYEEVKAIIKREGELSIWKRVKEYGNKK
jgi:stage II sporulation protein D